MPRDIDRYKTFPKSVDKEGGEQHASAVDVPEYEMLVDEAGGVGRFQILSFILIELQIMADSWLIYNLSYLLLYPKFECFVDGKQITDEGSDIWMEKCQPQYYCKNMDEVTLNRDNSSNISLQNWIYYFDFLCLSGFEISAFGMLNFIGFFISSPIVPKFQDKLGRKKVFMVNSLLNALTLLGILLLPSQRHPTQAILYVLMFINGLATGGRVITGYTYFQEFYPDRAASIIGTIWNCTEGTIIIWITIYFVYISIDWRWLIWYACASNFLALFIGAWLLPESPKWLYDQEKFHDCSKVLQYIGKFNGKKDMHQINALMRSEMMTSDIAGKQSSNQQEINDSAAIGIGKDKKRSVYKEILSNGLMFRNFLGMITVWTSASFGYYLISYQLKYIKGDFYINNITSAISEILGYTTSGILFKQLGIKITFISSYALAIAGMLSLTLVSPEEQFLLSLFILGSKYGVCQLFNLSYVGTTHLFPIAYVATVFGICNMTSRAFQTLAPFVAELKPDYIGQWVFIILMGVSLAISFIIKDPKSKKGGSSEII